MANTRWIGDGASSVDAMFVDRQLNDRIIVMASSEQLDNMRASGCGKVSECSEL